jgi:hypothetical protein
MSRSRVTVRDRGADAAIKRARGRMTVKVGVIGAKAAEPKKGGASAKLTGNTVAEIATIHEFGIGVPRRSFIADYVDEDQPDLEKRLSLSARNIVKGKAMKEQEAERFGLYVVGQMQERIARGIAPPLHPETIRRKGSATPLIDTGQLRSSITHKVEVDRG